MTDNPRTCLACGRPLTGRQKKWCKRPDCSGWELLHPHIMETCACGETFETYKGLQDKCPKCRPIPPETLVTRTCIQCGKEFTCSERRDPNWIWCNGFCYERYMQENPQPDYFPREREFWKNGLCFECGTTLSPDQRRQGYCSARCHAIYRARMPYRQEEQRARIAAEGHPELVKVFNYVLTTQWWEAHPNGAREWPGGGTEQAREYDKEYRLEYSRESVRMATRKKLGLPEDALLPDRTPTTTELPIKLWLEEHNIEFESQCYIEIGGTFTRVDFFIPLPRSGEGICLYCDGDYWHGPEFPETLEKDRMQTRELEKLGHIVIRLRESDIQNGVRPIRVLELYSPFPNRHISRGTDASAAGGREDMSRRRSA